MKHKQRNKDAVRLSVSVGVGLLVALSLFGWDAYKKHVTKKQYQTTRTELDWMETQIASLSDSANTIHDFKKLESMYEQTDSIYGEFAILLLTDFNLSVDEARKQRDTMDQVRTATRMQLERNRGRFTNQLK